MPPVDSLPRDENTLRILLTTDNHVGYLENDPIRGDDSWKTFQEITYMAKTHDVDMIVQGGDLFHVSKPSKKSLYHVLQALRLNCLGDRPCELELLSDPSSALRSGEQVNYEDPNLNVSVPVFAISGNHDDATGEGLLSPLDVLAATGLVNFFGSAPRSDKLTVSPLVFQKGFTKLALYGINNMRDERLQRIMKNGDMTFQNPRSSSDFFNLLCIHQNHFRHTPTSYVPEDFLPSFMDFVMWGHEHECIPFPQYNPTTGFDTLQPGSSVATSLSEGETAPKHVFLLDIRGKDYTITPLPLQSVRPFVMKDVSLQEENFVEGPASKADISAFLVEQVEDLIESAGKLNEGEDSPAEPLLPMVRLRVDHTGDYEIENSTRFSNRFVGKVANVNDILRYHKKKASSAAPERKIDTRVAEPDSTHNVSIQRLLKQFLGDSNLYLVPEDGMFDATKRYIEQDDKQILSDYVKTTLSSATKSLQDINIDEEEFHLGDEDTVKKSFRQLLNKLRSEKQRKPLEDLKNVQMVSAGKDAAGLISDDDEPVAKPTKSVGEPVGNGQGSRKPKSSAVVQDSGSDYSEVEDEPAPKKIPAKRKKKTDEVAKPKRQTKPAKKSTKAGPSLDDLLLLG